MRKLIAFILSLIYLTTAIGATIELHYCMGKVVGSEVGLNSSVSGCVKCEVQESADKGCCSDEQKQLKVSDQKVPTIYEWLNGNKTFEVTRVDGGIQLLNSTFLDRSSFVYSPPQIEKVPVFVLNCVYRI